MKKMKAVKKDSNKINLITNILTPFVKENRFVMNVTSSECLINQVPFSQSIINFFNTYGEVFGIVIESIVIDPEINIDTLNLYVENGTSDISYAQIIFRPYIQESTFSEPLMYTESNFEFEEYYLKNDFTETDFHFYLLTCLTKFADSCKKQFLNHDITNSIRFYPARRAKIRGVSGYVIESLAIETRNDMLYNITKLSLEDKIKVYGLRHGKDVSKPTTIENSVLYSRFGWFITKSASENILSKKKQEYRLTKKNYEELSKIDENIFDFFDEMNKEE